MDLQPCSLPTISVPAVACAVVCAVNDDFEWRCLSGVYQVVSNASALSSTNHHLVVLPLHIHILSLSLASLPCITSVQLKVVEAEGDDGSGWDRGHAGEPTVDEYGEQEESRSQAVEQEKKQEQEQEQEQGNNGTLSGGGSGKDRALSEPPTANIGVIAALLRQVGELEAQVETERKRGTASAEMAERLARQLDHVTAVRVLLCTVVYCCVLCVLLCTVCTVCTV